MKRRAPLYDLAFLKRLQVEIEALPRRRFVASVHWFSGDQGVLYVWRRTKRAEYDMTDPLLWFDQFGAIFCGATPVAVIGPILAAITDRAIRHDAAKSDTSEVS